jgi:DNA-binding CsgD family transcriptional regulator
MPRALTLILFTVFLLGSPASAQLSYQLSNYSFSESGAGNQNWDITTDDQQRVLVANNYGLLILENTNITLHELRNKTIFRSVAYLDGRIYTGSFEDFGYWEESDDGEMTYTSLVPLLDNPNLNNDEIWRIIQHEGKIYFHSFGSIYSYDGEQVTRLDKNGSYMFLHKVNGEVITQRVNDGLYRLTNDTFMKIPGSYSFADEELKSVIALDDETVLIGTTEGIYSYSGSTFNRWQGEQSSEVVQNSINTMVRTNDKIIIGTILNGIYIYDLDFRLLKNINSETQLLNNTVLSLAVDSFDNLWIGMDKGLTYIAFDTPLHTYWDPAHPIGSVYAAALFQNELYIGTNQGVFWYKRDSNGNFYDKTLIPESQGQVWFIKEFDGYLYCGLNDGTYVIRDKQLQKVSDIFGGYNLKSYPNENLNVLVQSTYSDISVYEKEDELWKQSYNLEVFSTPARFLEFDHIGNIWLGHTVRGIYRLQPNIQFNRVESVTRIGSNEGLSQSSNRVFKLDNRIITSLGDSLFQWDAIDEMFVPYTDLYPYFTEKGEVRNIIPAGNQRYWVVKNSELILVEVHFSTIRLIYRLIPEMFDYHLVEEYENVIPLGERLHLISLEDGFAILNLDLANQSKYPKPSVRIQSLSSASSYRDDFDPVSLTQPETELPFRDNTLRFSWSTSQIVGNQIYFQYRLSGLENEWSSWTTNTSAIFERLTSGEYSFQVRSIAPNGFLTETTNLYFKIKQPWYFSTGAYVFYFLVFISFGFMIRLYISRKRWKALGRDLELKHKKIQRDREKAEKEIIKLNNEKLQQEIEHKSSQLASNTMSIMRKNNLLSSIKDELKKQKDDLGEALPDKYVNRITKLIDQGIEDEHEWEVFEQLYDQAHGNFFKRLKDKYPQLTPSDLRLCAYLRMNLSSKEIAPLLNISVRGVEERRYRLRKRLDLSTDTNLTELIMTF